MGQLRKGKRASERAQKKAHHKKLSDLSNQPIQDPARQSAIIKQLNNRRDQKINETIPDWKKVYGIMILLYGHREDSRGDRIALFTAYAFYDNNDKTCVIIPWKDRPKRKIIL